MDLFVWQFKNDSFKQISWYFSLLCHLSLSLLEVDNPVDNIERYEEGRETLQEELVNSANTRISEFSF